MLSVKDGDRTLQFNGTLLGKSSSERRGAYRWIEFELYRTESGSFILSRIGVSLIFHGAACSLVTKYKLPDAPNYELRENATPCPECNPDFSLDLVFPEKYRYWALVSENPEAVLEALYKHDDYGTKYLTSVAQRLLEGAARLDLDLASVYNYQIIP
jgi:hypothetical protein|tara:strand:+ start:198 stop:668 length:471 start_codon:yes stop_codon:yes gene_type:complete